MTFNTGFSKSIFKSTTFWSAAIGALTMLFPTLAAKFGITTDSVANIAQHIVLGLSTIGVIYGRFTATQTVTLTGGAPPSPTAMSGTKG